MKTFTNFFLVAAMLTACNSATKTASSDASAEPHRPLIHFSPPEKWMNDPNGLVYHNNTYHFFYQYYPDSTIWGPMHWGHATSKDLMQWEHQPVALYPDSLGYIFSGSAVVDFNNSSGLGVNGRPPLVAIFTHHNAEQEKAGRADFQNQSIAYSNDDGKTWTKFEGNPVLKSPGIKDFRDPKVSWYEPAKKWVMTLATQDRITFYNSPDLKSWTKLSEFGQDVGAHGGVWECPDLFPLSYQGQEHWVLIVSINPGGPNGGSATQYFVGSFDGTTFTPYKTDIRWIDYGPDNYAGITWFNTGDRKTFIGWMNNWQYANRVPTARWRGAATLPRDLDLDKIGEDYYVRSRPVPELEKIVQQTNELENQSIGDLEITQRFGNLQGPARLILSGDQIKNFEIVLSNNKDQEVTIGYNHNDKQYFIDRTASGKVDFEKGFAARHVAQRLSKQASFDMTLIIDQASVELFADNGLTVMTQTFFPDEPFTSIRLQGDSVMLKKLQLSTLRPVN